ncbi:uncharacterized protein [Paramisgurnus dabryanus]|uniref:uncharacterized protein n=1 Tax=Paramisgurnus dabryanus TaxID=90735 RepID=UPI0031F36C61
MFALFSLIGLLVIPGMCSQNWTVKYSHSVKCVVKGSTTRLSSSYTYPYGLNIIKIFWTIDPVKDEDLSEVPEYKGRFKYILDKKQNVILRLSNITDEDEHVYYMKIVTNVEKEKYLGYPGIQLNVTGLRVEIHNEGNSAVLFCKTTCNLTSSTNFIWYKNKSPLSESFSNKLKLQSVSSDDEGDYSCAVRGHEHLKSPAVTLRILTENSPTMGVILAVVITSVSVILLVVIGICIRRKKTTSAVQNNTNLQHHITMKSSEETYMTLDPNTTSADYDTLDNVRKSTDKR